MGVVAHCSSFVQGVKLQLSLCTGCKAVLFFLSRGEYSDSIILSRV